jgi:two-component system response regulator YesN
MTGAPTSGKTILIADDNVAQRRFLQLLLAMDGHNIIVVEDGLEALEYLQTHSPDLVLSDVNMPYMTGLELCQQVKRVKPKLPVILLTSMDDDMTERLAKEARVDAFIRKPVVGKGLREQVQRLLSLANLTVF